MFALKSELRKNTASNCTCLGHYQIFECTAVGLGATIWTGSVFQDQCPDDELVLLHSEFENGVRKECGPNIIAQSMNVNVTDDSFTSHLKVLVTSNFADGTVQCIYRNQTSINNIGSESVNIAGKKLGMLRWI